jgi:hypothetical protein
MELSSIPFGIRRRLSVRPKQSLTWMEVSLYTPTPLTNTIGKAPNGKALPMNTLTTLSILVVTLRLYPASY